MVTSNSEQDDLMGLLIAVSREDRLAFQRLYEKISGRMFGLCHWPVSEIWQKRPFRMPLCRYGTTLVNITVSVALP